MLDLKKAKARETRLLQQKAKLESDLARAQKRLKDAARRADTRRKIVLGGALLAAVEKGSIPQDAISNLVADFVAERDRPLFEGGPFAVVGIVESGAVSAVPDRQE